MDDLELALQREAPGRAEALRALIEGDLPAEANLRMEVTLVMPPAGKSGLRAGLRIGEKKWYVVKDIPELLDAWRTGAPLSFPSRFVYEPAWMRFSEENERILRLLERQVAAFRMGRWTPTAAESRMMPLPEAASAELLELLRDMPLRVMGADGEIVSSRGIPEANLPLRAECRMTPRGLSITMAMPERLRPMTEDCAYVHDAGRPPAGPKDQRALMRYLVEHGSMRARSGRTLGCRPWIRRWGRCCPI